MEASQNNFNKSLVKESSGLIYIDKNPVCLLYEVFGKVHCVSSLLTGVHNKCCFEVKITVKGKRYSSKATTLKMAKSLCALAALSDLCNVCYDNNKMQLYVHVPVPKRFNSGNVKKIKATKPESKNNLVNNSLQQSEVGFTEVLNEPAKIITETLSPPQVKLPLIIEEIDNNGQVIPNNRQKKVLSNITNSNLVIERKLNGATKDFNAKTVNNNLSITKFSNKTKVKKTSQTNLRSYTKNPVKILETSLVSSYQKTDLKGIFSSFFFHLL